MAHQAGKWQWPMACGEQSGSKASVPQELFEEITVLGKRSLRKSGVEGGAKFLEFANEIHSFEAIKVRVWLGAPIGGDDVGIAILQESGRGIHLKDIRLNETKLNDKRARYLGEVLQ